MRDERKSAVCTGIHCGNGDNRVKDSHIHKNRIRIDNFYKKKEGGGNERQRKVLPEKFARTKFTTHLRENNNKSSEKRNGAYTDLQRRY